MRSHMKPKKIFVVVLLLSFCSQLTAQTIAPFKAGDKIAFVGNSITDAGFYHSYIWLYYMTRFPDRRIQVLNKGIGGDDAGLINNRLPVEVFPEKPTVLALTFGMNDSGYFEYLNEKKDSLAQVKWQKSFDSYQQVEAKLKQQPSIRKIIFTTAPYDETTTSAKNNLYPGKTKTIEQIIQFQKASAQKNGWEYLDLNGEMTAINQREQAKDPAFSLSPGDRIHPGVGGHLVMAYFFLKAQGMAGKPVAAVAIDATTKKILKQENSTVTNLSVSPGMVAFDYLAKALPFPIDTMSRMWNSNSNQREALAVIPFMEEMNREDLQVKGLLPGTYTLKIGGQKIGAWTATDFANGINLAAHMNTPQYQQACIIRDLNQERMEIERRFRQYNWMEFDVLREKGLLRKHNQQALDAVMAEINNGFIRGNFENWNKGRSEAVRDVWTAQMKLLVDKIYAINKPVKRRITLEKN